MATRRPTDGWLCKNCQGVFFERVDPKCPLCPWCARDLVHASTGQPPVVRRRLKEIGKRLQMLAQRDGWDCWLCGQPIDPYHLGVHRASADRVRPGRLGGTYDLTNCRLAHASCNEYRAGSRVKPFAPFDNSATADYERLEALVR